MLAGLEEDLSRRYKSCILLLQEVLNYTHLAYKAKLTYFFPLQFYYFFSGRIDQEAIQGYADKIEALTNAVGGTTPVRISATTIGRAARETRYGIL